MNTEELQDAYGYQKLWGNGFSKDFRRDANSYDKVKEFHETFGHPVATEPTVVSDDRLVLRLTLILEEAIELADAMGFATDDIKDSAEYMLHEIGPRVYEEDVDLVAVADALGDLEYVVNGAALEMGIPLPEVVAEVHRSNMTKLDSDGKPIYREDGKILKGEGFEEPRLAEVLGF